MYTIEFSADVPKIVI